VIETARYTLAYSPCPNDTYIFAALAHGLLGGGAPLVRVELADVETLNEAATRRTHELTKISYGAIPYVADRYRILRSGGALGRGCGPLAIVRPGTVANLQSLSGKRVAIPGERTTAYLLLRLAAAEMRVANIVPVAMRFDRIVAAVAQGQVDAGLIIHESRFTYRESGLTKLLDLGEWWDMRTGLPIPLGAILSRDDLGPQRAEEFADTVRRSLAFARSNEDAIMPYVREHAFEMDESVMRKHIELYVNDFSVDVGEAGVAAVRELFARARAAGIIPVAAEPRFA
jgi:1,4-dihydroxy-6-naphthoate synthase